MKKKRAAEGTSGKVVAGVTVLVLGIAGLGWVRRRAAGERGGQCKVVEESVYRGFKYRIEECPAGEGRVYLGLVPSQQVGTITITTDESESLDTIDDARKYVQSSIDAKLGPQLKAVFVGANR